MFSTTDQQRRPSAHRQLRSRSAALIALAMVLAACSSGSPAPKVTAPAAAKPYPSGKLKPWKAVSTLSLPAPALVAGYLSDQVWQSAASGWGPVELDRSNGEDSGGDGNTLSLSGVTYVKGLGVHSNSSVVYNLDGKCLTFEASVGLDDEARGDPDHGSVVFKVYGDNKELFNSGVMDGSSVTQALRVNLGGYRTLRLEVDQNENETEGDASQWSDHADWANARMSCGAASPSGPAPTNPAPPASGRIQAEDFASYLDNDPENQGGLYRPSEGVDIDQRGNPEGYGVGWSGPGEWLKYDITIGSSGTYALNLRAATFRAGEKLEISIDGAVVLSPTLPNTGSFEILQVMNLGNVKLSAGKHELKVAFVGNNPAVNLDWLQFTPAGGAAPAPSAPPPAPPVTPPPTAPAPSGPSVSATFTGSDEDFTNPERGFYGYGSDLAADSSGSLQGVASSGFSLAHSYVRLDGYRNRSLDADWLSKLDQGFARARQAGVKVVLRFSYNFPQVDPATGQIDYQSAPDANLSRVLEHIEQIKPVLARNTDVIAYWQAGFVGGWGEWHDSTNNLDSDANKVVIRDALLGAVPAGRFLQMRYPEDMRNWYPSPPSEADAFTGRARIGIYNDCFLAGPGDTGTYSGLNDRLREYTKTLSEVAPFGAETCDVGGFSNLRMQCSDILREGRDYSLTYLNVNFYNEFIKGWKSQGCYDEVSRSMGYRFRLTRASHPASVSRGGVLPVQLTISNDGWSRLFNARSIRVVLRNTATGQQFEGSSTQVDPRRWRSGSSNDVTVGVNVGQVSTGTYDVLIGLPDAAPNLRSDARYSIRFANADDASRNQAWEAAAGLFRLGTRVTVN